MKSDHRVNLSVCVVDFIRQLVKSQHLDIWSHIILDVSAQVFFR